MTRAALSEAVVSAAAWWTPERGGLEADGSVRALQRWTRVLISVVEEVLSPLGDDTCVVVATRTGHDDLCSDLAALQSRWPGWGVVAVEADEATVPLALVDAISSQGRFETVVFATVELTPAAELGVAVRLGTQPGGARISVVPASPYGRGEGAEPGRGRFESNPCSAALALARGIETGAVSIRVAGWEIVVSSPVPDR